MSWNRINLLRRVLRTSIIKSIYINFKTLPLRQAIKMPILVTSNTYFYSVSGKIKLEGDAHFGMVRFGYMGEDTIYPYSVRTILQLDGTLILNNDVHFGNGLTIRILPNATLRIGENVKINNKTKIICYDSIWIKRDTRFAWECQVLDTSFHYIRDLQTKSVSKLTSPIIIGAHNWIGNRVTIMKGVETPNYTIAGACSLLNKKYEIPEYSLIAGSPAKLIKTGIYRCLDKEEAMIRKQYNNDNI